MRLRQPTWLSPARLRGPQHRLPDENPPLTWMRIRRDHTFQHPSARWIVTKLRLPKYGVARGPILSQLPWMKIRSIWAAALGAGALVSCDVEQEETMTATEVEEVASEEAEDIERSIEQMQTEFDEMPPPDEPDDLEVIPAPIDEIDEDYEQADARRTVGDRVDDALDATGRGLRTAGEKTGEGLETAAEKTGEGLQRAAGATGRFLQRAGEKIEEVAEDE